LVRADIREPNILPTSERLSFAAQAWLLFAFVLIDLTAKMVMFHTLPPDQPIHECVVCLILRANSLNLGSGARQLFAYYGMRPLIASALFAFLLAALLWVAALSSRLTKRSVALSIVVALMCASSLIALLPSSIPLPLFTVAATARAAATILWVTIWALAPSPLWKAGALFFAAAGLSNFVSLALPPFQVVDYLWSSPLYRTIGFGVFNLADLLWLIGSAILAIALLFSIVRWLVLLWTRSWSAFRRPAVPQRS
jgi:lipoprotein signal peptidase